MIQWLKDRLGKNEHLEDGFISAKEIEKDKRLDLRTINDELEQGFDFIKRFPKSVSIFGSARFKPGTPHYESAKALGAKISKETGYTIITGGGPGIMEGANCGAASVGGESAGLCITLPREQTTNPCVQHSMNFRYFFTRKTLLTFAAEAFVFFPGGFGTFDELFDILTLVQTKKIPVVPIILVGADFWKPLDVFIKKQMLEENATINADDLGLYKITDDHNEVVEIIKRAPVTNWWKEFEK